MSRRESERGGEWRVKSGEAQRGREGLCQFLKNFALGGKYMFQNRKKYIWFWKCSINLQVEHHSSIVSEQEIICSSVLPL